MSGYSTLASMSPSLSSSKCRTRNSPDNDLTIGDLPRNRSGQKTRSDKRAEIGSELANKLTKSLLSQ